MQNPIAPSPDDARLEESLLRLDIHELEERLELAPLVADPALEGADGCRCFCDCSYDPSDPPVIQNVPSPDHGGFNNQYGPF